MAISIILLTMALVAYIEVQEAIFIDTPLENIALFTGPFVYFVLLAWIVFF